MGYQNLGQRYDFSFIVPIGALLIFALTNTILNVVTYVAVTNADKNIDCAQYIADMPILPYDTSHQKTAHTFIYSDGSRAKNTERVGHVLHECVLEMHIALRDLNTMRGMGTGRRLQPSRPSRQERQKQARIKASCRAVTGGESACSEACQWMTCAPRQGQCSTNCQVDMSIGKNPVACSGYAADATCAPTSLCSCCAGASFNDCCPSNITSGQGYCDIIPASFGMF